MKTDRFMKVMLVIIALLLVLNCANYIRSPFLGNSTEAAAPPRFLQKGKVYFFALGEGLLDGNFKVMAIEDTGWIQVTRWDTEKNQPSPNLLMWVNTAMLVRITE